MSRDPIGLRGGHNLFTYVNNNPVSSVDEDGLDPTLLQCTKMGFDGLNECLDGCESSMSLWDSACRSFGADDTSLQCQIGCRREYNYQMNACGLTVPPGRSPKMPHMSVPEPEEPPMPPGWQPPWEPNRCEQCSEQANRSP